MTLRTNNQIKNKLRVAIVQAIIAPTREPWFTSLAAFDDLDINVFVLSETLEHRPGWKTRQDNNYAVTLIKSIVIKRKWKFSGAKYSDTARRIIPIGLTTSLIRYKPDYVAVTNATEMLSAIVVRLIIKSKIALLGEDTLVSYSRMSRIRKFFKKLLYRKADIIFAHSTECIKLLEYIGINSSKIKLTPWAVDNDKFRLLSDSSDIESIRSNHITNTIIFTTVGSLTPRKGHAILLRAWTTVCMKYNGPISLIFIGDGNEKETLLNYLAEHDIHNVIITGHLPPDRVALYLGASDVFIFPTLEDVWGLSVNEAMAAGLPVIVSKYAGCHSDLVKPAMNGFVYDPYNEDELPDIILNILKNTDQIKNMGQKSLDIIQSFSIETSTRTMHDTFTQSTL